MCDNYIKLLIMPLETLSIKFPFTFTLQSVMEREFRMISQREAYEVLRYLLKACGKQEFPDYIFSEERWKSTDSEIKKKLEKCKNIIFEELKLISKENKVILPKLKKSDLLLPFCALYFNTCLSLASYALSYQLEECGIYFWPKDVKSSAQYENMKVFSSKIRTEESDEFELQQKNLTYDIETLKSAINEVEKRKIALNLLLKKEIMKCPEKYRGGLSEESERSNVMNSWKSEIDDLHEKNLKKIEAIEVLNEQVNHLSKLMDKKEKYIISGEELLRNVTFEVENIAENHGLSLCCENQFNLPALFNMARMCIPKDLKNKEIIKDLLNLEIPKINFELLNTLEVQKKKLEERIEKLHNGMIDECIKKTADSWFEAFFVSVPAIKFDTVNVFSLPRHPVFNEEKLLRFCEISDKNSQCKSVIEPEIPKKRDMKKLRKTCWKRKSISLENLSSVSTPSMKQLNSEKADSISDNESSTQNNKLCSTPKENYNRSFIYDRSISPISVHSAKDKSIGRKVVNDIVNDSILSDSDIQVSLLNSYLSTDLDIKTEKKEETFDFSTSIQEISLDPTPSVLSVNLSTISEKL